MTIIQSKFSLFMGLFFLSVGIGLFVACYYWYHHATWLFFEGEEASGKITNYTVTERYRFDDPDIHHAVFEFKTDRGVRVVVEDLLGSDSIDYGVGEEVTVYYNPLNPRQAAISSFITFFLPLLFFGLLGVAFFMSGGYIACVVSRQKHITTDEV